VGSRREIMKQATKKEKRPDSRDDLPHLKPDSPNIKTLACPVMKDRPMLSIWL
jgi:hypothetical protein